MYSARHARPCEPWIYLTFESDKSFFDYLETLRGQALRPAHIVVECKTETEIKKVLEMLYVPQVFWLQGTKLSGGFGYTRRYLCRPNVYPKVFGFEVIDGGKFAFNGDQ